jgi:HSP20 family molecular chaperone IbpA
MLMRNYYNTAMKSSDIFDVFRHFDDPFGVQTLDRYRTTSPYRIEDTAKCLILSIDFPGVKPNDLKIQTSGRTLTVSGKRRDEDFKYIMHYLNYCCTRAALQRL